MPALLGFRTAVLALALVLAACVGIAHLAAPAAADPPVVKNDHKWMFPHQFRSIDVLANDSDPDGDELAVCRIQADPDDATYATETDGRRIEVWTGEDPGEDLVIHYWVCDFETLVPATLTISFRELHPIEVTKLGRPGLLRVRNDNVRPVRFLYGSFRNERPDGRVTVPVEGSVVIRVHRRKIDWIAFFPRGGVLVGIGHVRRIDLPGRDLAGETTRVRFDASDLRHWSSHR